MSILATSWRRPAVPLVSPSSSKCQLQCDLDNQAVLQLRTPSGEVREYYYTSIGLQSEKGTCEAGYNHRVDAHFVSPPRQVVLHPFGIVTFGPSAKPIW